MHDLKVAIRSLRAAPAVAIAAVLSLALGIGANTAIFSLVDSVMFRALRVHAPERLAWFVVPRLGVPAKTRFAVFEEIRARGQLFDGVLATASSKLTLTTGGESQAIDGLFTSGSFFDVLGVRAFVGRTFSMADDASEAPGAIAPVAVISYGFWQRQFGGAPDIVGRSVTLDTVPVTIVGVTPPLFFGADVGRTFDVAVPLGVERAMHGVESWATRASLPGPLSVMVRLKPGQTIETATAAIRSVQPQIRAATLPPADLPAQYLGQFLSDPLTLEPAVSVPSPVQRRFTPSLMTLMAVVALVLLIACANLANLQLARANARTRELAVRRALGASRWQLARQLLTESALVGGLGAALGVVLAQWSSRALVRAISTAANPVVLDLSLDVRVLLFTIAAAALTIAAFGVGPALRASTVSAAAAIRSDRSAVGEGVRVGTTQLLIVAQVALALVLVTGAGLFARTFASLVERPLGFDAAPVLVVAINAQRAAATPTQRVPLYARVREVVRRLPGVADAAVSARAPIVNGPMLALPIARVSGAPPVRPSNRISFVNLTSDGWFRTLGARLVAGRDFSGSDARQSTPVAIVNQAFAHTYVEAADPIGRRVAVNVPRPGPPPEFEIVGVVADTVYGSLRTPDSPAIYLPMAQLDDMVWLASASLIVRSSGPPAASLAAAVARAIRDVNPQLSTTVETMQEQIDGALAQERVLALLSGAFGALALFLASVGLYGVTAYAVARRRVEMGIRMALGATPGGLVRVVLARVCVLIAVGVAAGAGASAWASRFVASLLYGLQPRDPATLAAAAIVLAAVAITAAWVPAWRASRIDPAEVLREM